jgi:hypothetical protein
MRTPPARLLYAAIAVVVVLIALVAAYFQQIEVKDLVVAALPVMTTFLGATLAFRLNEDREEKREQLRRKQALDFSLFVLLRQDNAVGQSIEPYRTAANDAERAFVVPALKPPDYLGLRQDIASLAFLLELGHPQLLFELSIEQERFEQAFEALRTRNQFYVDELQPALESTGMNGRPVTLAEAKGLLGERIFESSMNQAHILFDHFQASEKSIPKMFASIRSTAKELFPSAAFVSYERDAPPKEPSS